MLRLCALVVLFGVAGCALPPAFTVATLLLDGLSYAASGKGIGDHALSIATDKDCAMLRLLSEQDFKAVCRDESETAIALKTTAGDAIEQEELAPPVFEPGSEHVVAAIPSLAPTVQSAPRVITPAAWEPSGSAPVNGLAVVAVWSPTSTARPVPRVITPAAWEPPVSEPFANGLLAAAKTPRDAATPENAPIATPPLPRTVQPVSQVVALAPAKAPVVERGHTDTGISTLPIARTVGPAPPVSDMAASKAPEIEPATNGALEAAGSEVEVHESTYLVVGSYLILDNAEELVERLAEVPTSVKPARVKGSLYFRVVTGPFGSDEVAAARARLASLGVGDSWRINLCSADLGPPPCSATPPVDQLLAFKTSGR